MIPAGPRCSGCLELLGTDRAADDVEAHGETFTVHGGGGACRGLLLSAAEIEARGVPESAAPSGGRGRPPSDRPEISPPRPAPATPIAGPPRTRDRRCARRLRKPMPEPRG